MWDKANLADIGKQADGSLKLIVVFSSHDADGKLLEEVKEEYPFNSQDASATIISTLKNRCKTKLAELNNADTVKTDISTGDIDLSDADDTENEARMAFQADFRKLQQFRFLINAGVYADDHEDYATLKNAVKDGYKLDYL